MNHVCDEKVWDRVLSFNFSIFSNRVKRNLEDDLEIFLYLKFRFYSFVFSNLSLYSIFSHFYFCKRTCDQKKSSVIVNSVLEFIHKFLIMLMLFKTLLLMNEILLLSLINFFKNLHYFLSTFTTITHFLLIQEKLRFTNVHILDLLGLQISSLNLF